MRYQIVEVVKRLRLANAVTRSACHRVGSLLLGIALLAGGCASAPAPAPPRTLTVHDELPAGAEKGYIEFYCTDCLSNFSIFRVEDKKEKLVTTFSIGKTTSAAVQAIDRDVRVTRLRIAQPPGEGSYLVAAASPRFKGLPQRFTASIEQDHLTPIRMNFIRYTNVSLDWKVVVGPPLPLTTASSFMESLTTALSAPDWGTRWYGAEALIISGHEISSDSALAQRLQELSGEESYQQCLAHEEMFACSLVRQQATQALKAVAAPSP